MMYNAPGRLLPYPFLQSFPGCCKDSMKVTLRFVRGCWHSAHPLLARTPARTNVTIDYWGSTGPRGVRGEVHARLENELAGSVLRKSDLE